MSDKLSLKTGEEILKTIESLDMAEGVTPELIHYKDNYYILQETRTTGDGENTHFYKQVSLMEV